MKPNDQAYQAALRATSDSCSAYQIQNALDAAYAAQFPPSEDYAGLIETLRSSSPYTLSHVAADAIEAVLAERDALRKWKEEDSTTMRIFARYRELEAEVAAWKGRQEATAALLKQVEAERDALLARLAPENNEALVEIATREIFIERRSLASAIAAVTEERDRLQIMHDSAYISGMKHGWNCCAAGEEERYKNSIENIREQIRRARAALEGVTEKSGAGNE